MSEKTIAKENHSIDQIPPLRSPGYFACRRIINRLMFFQELIVHYAGFPRYTHFARPIEELLPQNTDEVFRELLLEQQIRRLAITIFGYLYHIGIATESTTAFHDDVFNNEKGIFEFKRIERPIDVIMDCLEIARHPEGVYMIMQALDGGIGVYEAIKRQALKELFYPITWLAYILRLPISVLEKAGLANKETQTTLVKAYGWIVRLSMLILITFGLAKLGISIPWKEVLNHVFLKLL